MWKQQPETILQNTTVGTHQSNWSEKRSFPLRGEWKNPPLETSPQWCPTRTSLCLLPEMNLVHHKSNSWRKANLYHIAINNSCNQRQAWPLQQPCQWFHSSFHQHASHQILYERPPPMCTWKPQVLCTTFYTALCTPQSTQIPTQTKSHSKFNSLASSLTIRGTKPEYVKFPSGSSVLWCSGKYCKKKKRRRSSHQQEPTSHHESNWCSIHFLKSEKLMRKSTTRVELWKIDQCSRIVAIHSFQPFGVWTGSYWGCWQYEMLLLSKISESILEHQNWNKKITFLFMPKQLQTISLAQYTENPTIINLVPGSWNCKFMISLLLTQTNEIASFWNDNQKSMCEKFSQVYSREL